MQIEMTEIQQTFYFLSVSLAIGLLIGVERGWKERDAEEGRRIAGVRTYGLIGLMGGATALLAKHIGSLIFGLAFAGLAAVLTTAYVINLSYVSKDVSITSLVSGLLVFVLGALAAIGEVTISAAFAVVTTLLLGYKPLLHRWVNALEAEELRAGIRLLLISVVLLPFLPNRGYGPWQALNPYIIWWMVVLIATISFVGYFAIKIGGTTRGAIFTGLFGGLASSTAVTLNFSRMAHQDAALTPMLSTGILLACGTMFPRMLLVASLLNNGLFQPMLVPAAVMMLFLYLPALWYSRMSAHRKSDTVFSFDNPLELNTALGFGLLLVLVMLLGKMLRNWFGNLGILALAAASGVADVDAITLSLARMSQTDLAVSDTVIGIMIAAAVNNLVKGGMATVIGGKAMGLRVGLPMLASTLGGLASTWLWIG